MKFRTIAFALLAMCLITAAALLARNSLASNRIALRNKVPFIQAAVPTVADSAVEVEVLTLDRRGFEPAEINRPVGRFMLAISNRTQEQHLSLELTRVRGPRVRAVDMARGRARALADLDLPAGEYLFSVTNHPAWTCRIVISPQ